jgi:hypothetical protein
MSVWRKVVAALGEPLRRARYSRLKKSLAGLTPAEVFTRIYRENLWGDVESRSGAGSNLAYTEAIRAALPKIIAAHGLRAIYDAPCGDFHWMRETQLPAGVAYHGADIVPDLIADLQKRYSAPGRSFSVGDIATTPFPDADLWICRDCMFHLSFADISRALSNFAASNVKYALLTTHIQDPAARFENRDILTGGARLIDLRSAPFNLPEPIERHADWVAPFPPREMALWSREMIAPAAAALAAHLAR